MPETIAVEADQNSLAERLANVEALLREPRAPVLDSLLTAEQLAARLGHSNTRRLDDWRGSGSGPAFVRVGRTPYYRTEAVDAWLLANERSSTAEEVR